MIATGTISEQILSRRCGHQARAGDIVVCDVDLLLGTDGSAPMAIDYFEQMRGERLCDPARVFFALDHYAPPDTPRTRGFHDRIRAFTSTHGGTVFEVGEGISHQLAVERGLVVPGDLVIGADSHTVTCGALNAFAIGVGSSDLAAAMKTGRIWLRVPDTIRVTFTGTPPAGISAKDVGLELVGRLGGDGANYQAIEFAGNVAAFSLPDRLVLSNLLVESGAKAAIFPVDDTTRAYLREPGGDREGTAITASSDARYVRELTVDLSTLSRRIARPHVPHDVVGLEDVAGLHVDMVFIGTCTGGRVEDVHAALAGFEDAGGRIAAGVQLVLTPASREVHDRLVADGTIRRFQDAGAIVTTPGCGACCGTSGVIPGDHMTVLSTANRNFKARMGNATARIYLASPAVCGEVAATGHIT